MKSETTYLYKIRQFRLAYMLKLSQQGESIVAIL